MFCQPLGGVEVFCYRRTGGNTLPAGRWCGCAAAQPFPTGRGKPLNNCHCCAVAAATTQKPYFVPRQGLCSCGCAATIQNTGFVAERIVADGSAQRGFTAKQRAAAVLRRNVPLRCGGGAACAAVVRRNVPHCAARPLGNRIKVAGRVLLCSRPAFFISSPSR